MSPKQIEFGFVQPSVEEARLANDLALTHKRLVLLRCALDKIKKRAIDASTSGPITMRAALSLIEIDAREVLTLDVLAGEHAEEPHEP